MNIEQQPRKHLRQTAGLAAWLSGAVLLVAAAGPALGTPGKAAVADPIGDTFGTGATRIDVIGFSATGDGDELVIALSFAGSISAPDSGRGDAITGFVDLDVDRDSATGGRPFVEFLSGNATGMGTELYVPLVTYGSDDGRVDLVDTAGVLGRVPVDWSPNAMSLRIPRALVGGDGVVYSAAVVGTLAEATDVVPETGFVASTGLPAGDPVLLRGRFRVELVWTDFEGGTGLGQLGVRTEDSAVFYFFNPQNWEVLVKVLDGCAFNDRMWVFAAATTDLEYALTVTDTETGAVKRYTNPLGTPSPAVTDTGAFTSCP